MRVPLSWLREYVELPDDLPALVERLSRAGLEVTSVHAYGLPLPAGLPASQAPLVWERDKVLVARILNIAKHPDADKLKLVTVEYGAEQPKTVVTGAPNIAVGESGQVVILGLRGCRYFSKDKEGRPCILTLEPRSLRGILNDAMCMSEFELGLSEDHEGIILLDPSTAPPAGTPAADLLGDVVLEIDVLPSMARCLGLVGLAREVAALTGLPLRLPVPHYPTASESVEQHVGVSIADTQLCPRYVAAIVRNVHVGPSPYWLQHRLRLAGMRPINNIVDITNYVMLEQGQPLHAFDYDILLQRAGGQPPRIIIRPAQAGETLVTLDGQKRELTPENLVIADSAGPIALAGVMGGQETEVTAQTRNILLEAATFDLVSIRKTARQYNLFSEASIRFSRGVPPAQVLSAARRALELFHHLAQGQIYAGVVDVFPNPPPIPKVHLTRDDISRLLGCSLPDGEVERILKALDFTLEPLPDGWQVHVPPTRMDIQSGAADLVEELARIYGYERLPERLLPLELPTPQSNRDWEYEEKVRDLLVLYGWQEVITYALSSPEAEARLHPKPHQAPPVEYVRLLNPISPERSILRRSLLPGLLSVVRHNLEHTDSLALFEIGLVYIPQSDSELPRELRRVALALYGRRHSPAWDDPPHSPAPQYDFFDLKGTLESLAADLHLPDIHYRATGTIPYLHPLRCAQLVTGNTLIGVAGQIHPRVADQWQLPRQVLLAELDLEALLAIAPERFAYRPIPPFPAAKRDIAVVVPAEMPAEQVFREIRTAGGPLLVRVELFDLYTGAGLPPDTKSLAFALTYQAQDRTLSDKEITKIHEKIEGRLRHVLGAKIRGKDMA
jgi:phenylalanyl-tRNA synthetase beta chain